MIIRKIVPLLLLGILILTSGFGCKSVDPEAQKRMQPITLDYWRVFDGRDDFEEIIKKYNKIHPNITINYKKLRYEEYEEKLIEAMARDRGPDMFSVHNSWMKKYQDILAPLPATLEMAYPVEKGGIENRVVPELRTKKTIGLKGLQEKFVDDISYTAVLKEGEGGNAEKNIYGLPLAVDNLAMYYNQNLLNNAGIANPPKYWNREFQKNIKKLTKQNTKGEIIQSGVALGGSENIARSQDILSLLMMQNGAEMMQNGNVTFHQIPSAFKNDNYNPGLEALRFYTDFAEPAKEVYCWNEDMKNSLDLFAEGKLAIMFGYSYHLPEIKSKSPSLEFSVTNMPQIEGNSKKINYGNYWLEGVSRKSDHIQEAWDFIHFATTNPENAKIYLENTDNLAALRSLINEQVDDPEIGVFAEQILTTKTWYKGESPLAAEEAMREMIDMANSGEQELIEVLSQGASRVQQTIRKD
jgi:ABC-type glycerol-3-phosphate transport system substrate-binding protein